MSTYSCSMLARARIALGFDGCSHSNEVSFSVLNDFLAQCSGGWRRQSSSWRRNVLLCARFCPATIIVRIWSCKTTRNLASLACRICIFGMSVCTIGISVVQYLPCGYIAGHPSGTNSTLVCTDAHRCAHFWKLSFRN